MCVCPHRLLRIFSCTPSLTMYVSLRVCVSLRASVCSLRVSICLCGCDSGCVCVCFGGGVSLIHKEAGGQLRLSWPWLHQLLYTITGVHASVCIQKRMQLPSVIVYRRRVCLVIHQSPTSSHHPSLRGARFRANFFSPSLALDSPTELTRSVVLSYQNKPSFKHPLPSLSLFLFPHQRFR